MRLINALILVFAALAGAAPGAAGPGVAGPDQAAGSSGPSLEKLAHPGPAGNARKLLVSMQLGRTIPLGGKGNDRITKMQFRLIG